MAKKSAKKKTKVLTALQKRFCDILLLMELAGKVEKRKAYELAGYKARGHIAEVEVTKTLNKPLVKAYLTRARKRRAARVEKTEAEIIREYERLGFSKITDYYNDDYTLKPVSELNEDQRAAIRSIEINEHHYTNKKGKAGKKVEIKIKLHTKKGALDSLANIYGMMKPDLKDVVSFAQALHEAMKEDGGHTKT